MIVVDSSVWIANLRGWDTQAVRKLHSLDCPDHMLVGDLILTEVLLGARTESQAAAIERQMRQFEVVSMLNDRLAVLAASHYRFLRKRGITIRKTIDLIVGTFCIENRHALLHDDRDFEPMTAYLGLRAF